MTTLSTFRPVLVIAMVNGRLHTVTAPTIEAATDIAQNVAGDGGAAVVVTGTGITLDACYGESDTHGFS